MMRYYSFYIVLLSTFCTQNLFAQRKPCSEEKKVIGELLQSQSKDDDSPLYIPTVLHIVYSNEEQNISKSQINSQIKSLNEDFNFENENRFEIIDAFKEVVGNCKISFYLSSLEENIIRVETSHTPFLNDDINYTSLGGSDVIDPDQFLNIWVADLAGDLFGYNKTRDFFPLDEEGIVVDFRYFGSNGSALAPYNFGRTLTHEIGHWLGLRHPWSSDSCEDGDGITDTPNQQDPIYSCDLQLVTCGSLDMVQNFMNLAPDDCLSFFTKGQKTVMRNTLLKNRTSLFKYDAPLKIDHNSISIYPNPAMSDFIVNSEQSIFSINIFDTTGKNIVFNYKELSPNMYSIRIKDAINGIVFITINTGIDMQTRKMILTNYL